MEKGLVIKNTGSWYHVKTDAGTVVECKIKGTFRLQGIRTTNPIAVGDVVHFDQAGHAEGLINKIEERKNYIIRKSTNLSKHSHIIAANLDQAFLIVTLKNPETSTVFIDRFLATAEAYRVPAKLIINKVDIYNDEDTEYLNALVLLYESIGYPCFSVSALTNQGVDEIRASLKDRITLFSGHSGVGKSTLVNAIDPALGARTNAISDYHHKGMHTTTFSEMFELQTGGYLVDTPGVKGFGTIDMKTEEISHYFPEIFGESMHCKFNNCTHVHEPGCAVLRAVEEHRISESRYKSYLSVLEDAKEGKYR